MEEKQTDKLDVASLLTSLADDFVASGSGRVSIGRGVVREVAPRSRITLRQLRSKLGVRQDDSASTVAAKYQGRAEAMDAALERRRARLEAFAERVRTNIPAKEDRFVAAGQLTDKESGNGLPNVGVRAIRTSRGKSEVLAETRTDALGYFRIETDGTAGFEVEFLGEDGEVMKSTKPSQPKKGSAEFLGVTGDGSRVPESRAVSKKIAESVAHNEAGLDRRRDTLSRKLQVGVDRVVRVVETKRRIAVTGRKDVVVRPIDDRKKKPAPTDRQKEERPTPTDRREDRKKDDAKSKEKDSSTLALEKVDGVGPKFAERLRKAGIKSANDLATADPKRVSGILGSGENRAKRIVKSAKNKVAGRG